MGLIKDVHEELRTLEYSHRSIRNFALTVGGIIVLLFGRLAWKGIAWAYAASIAGAFLMAAGVFVPGRLKKTYTMWMALAAAIGWVVSRLILTAVFFIILTPVGMLGRLMGKHFLIQRPVRGKESYWVKRDADKKMDYKKLY